MNHKHFRTALSAWSLGLGLGLALSIASLSAQAEVTLRFAHYSPESHAVHKAALQFKARVEERTKGEVKIAIFPNNTLGSPPEILEQTKLGVIDIAVPTSGQMDKYDKAFAALMLPFVFDDLAHARRTMDGPLQQWLAPLAAKSNLVIIGTWEYGFRNLTNNVRPVNTPADVKGMKVTKPDLGPFRTAMTPAYKQIGDFAGEDNVKTFSGYVEAARKR
ncbi:MAG: TRAP transporter substrate-binding protein [Rubrivivax sp.]